MLLKIFKVLMPALCKLDGSYGASINYILKNQGLMVSQGSYFELLGKSDEMKLLVQKFTYESVRACKFLFEIVFTKIYQILF